MQLSVIIPTRNRAETLKRCLEHLAASQGAPDFEVIVVSDGSTDHTAEIIKNFKLKIKNLNYLEQAHSQQGVARNLGVQKAKADLILFIGDDIFVAPDFLAQHYAAHQKNPEANVAVLGFTTWHPELPITDYMKFLEQGWQFNYPLLKPGFIEELPPWKFFYTSNISLKKSFFQKESFDPQFSGYGWEDIEFAYRLWKNHGLKMFYNPDAKTHHHHAFGETDLPKKMQQIGRAATTFQKLHPELNIIPTGLGKLRRTIGSWPIIRQILRRAWKFGYYYFQSWKEFYKGVSLSN